MSDLEVLESPDLFSDHVDVPGGDGGGGVGPVHLAGGGGGTLTLRPALARPAVDKHREPRGLRV